MGKKIIKKTPQKSVSKSSKQVKKSTKKSAQRTQQKPKSSKVVIKNAKIKKSSVPQKKKVITKSPKKIAKKDLKLTTAKPPKAPKKSAKAASGPQGYTEDEYKRFKDLKIKFGGYGNQQLKDLLRKNGQSMSGNKDELIFKCADGQILGKIPRCPKCFGGRPKFDFQKGTYYCSGYRDDVDFKNCQTLFQKNQITREPWQA